MYTDYDIFKVHTSVTAVNCQSCAWWI